MMNNHTLLKITKIEKNKIKTHCIGVRDVCVTGGGGGGGGGGESWEEGGEGDLRESI